MLGVCERGKRKKRQKTEFLFSVGQIQMIAWLEHSLKNLPLFKERRCLGPLVNTIFAKSHLAIKVSLSLNSLIVIKISFFSQLK